MAKSPRLSFKGYRLGIALYNNKDTLKLVLGALTGYGAYLGATGFDFTQFILVVGTAVGTLLSKLAYDAFEYYFTEVEL